MIAAALLAFREGLEAALVLGLVLSVLRRLGRRDQIGTAWLGAGLAAVLSLGAGVGLYALGLEFEGRGEQLFEGVTLLLAAGLLTWLIFWMDSHGRAVQAQLEQGMRQAAGREGRWGVLTVTFLAVLREGIELALFLVAAAFTATAATTLAGGAIGLGLAALAGWLIFATAARLNVRSFFRVTGLLLIVFAAGLVGRGVHELNEAGIIPALVQPLYNSSSLLDESSGVGQVAQVLLGYSAQPSLTQVAAYVGYWIAALWALSRRRARRPRAD